MTSVAIIGAGFAGLAAAVRLRAAGVEDVVLFEKSGDVGGVWRDTNYPGAACDVPSHLYSLSFSPKPDWSRRFAPQVEIHQYLRDVAAAFDDWVQRRLRGHGLRHGMPQLVPHRERAEHAELAGVDADLPPSAAPPTPVRLRARTVEGPRPRRTGARPRVTCVTVAR